jgi:hypothetical protein
MEEMANVHPLDLDVPLIAARGMTAMVLPGIQWAQGKDHFA